MINILDLAKRIEMATRHAPIEADEFNEQFFQDRLVIRIVFDELRTVMPIDKARRKAREEFIAAMLRQVTENAFPQPSRN
jgi:hypothetical protein